MSIFLLFSFFSLSCLGLPPSPPPFSWDTVPLFIHATNDSGPLNETAAKYMSSFPMATVDKTQDADSHPICTPNSGVLCEEDRIIAALKQIRSYNSETRTIFYLNAMLNWPQYNLSTNFLNQNKKYLLHDSNGNIVYLHQCGLNLPNVTIFDLSQNETVKFWLNTVKYALTKETGVVDGMFIDRGSGNLTNISQIGQGTNCNLNITTSQQEAWNNGLISMIQNAMDIVTSINKDRGIVIVNNVNIDPINARMFENFGFNDTWSSDQNKNDLTELMDNNDNNRIIEIHSYPAQYNKTLTAYLIGAHKYSYYACTEAWSLQEGWDEMWENSDYHKHLGEPISNATYNSDTKIYFREFKSGTKVWLDYEWEHPCIKWSDNTFTGNVTDCNKYT